MEKIYEIYLGESKNNKYKKVKSETITSLFCYNDIYRYLFSKKITNVESELNKINGDALLKKHFPKFNKDFIRIYNNNNLSFFKEKRFNHNFITFNIEKIYKYKNSMDISCPELIKFFDDLFAQLINEHKILYEINKKFFFKVDTNYMNYKNILNKIESLINNKKYDYLTMGEFLDKRFNEKENVYEITSGLCENIIEPNLLRHSRTSSASRINEEKKERKKSIHSNNEIKADNY